MKMRFFIVQSTEKDLDLDLFKRLFRFLASRTGIPIIEAKHQLRYSFGIIEIGKEAITEKLSEEFKRLGLDNFVLEVDEFITYPPPDPLDPDSPKILRTPGLVAAGAVLKERLLTETSQGTHYSKDASVRTVLPRAGDFRKEIQKTVYVDVFTQLDHFRLVVPPAKTAGVEKWLKQLQEETKDVSYSKSAEAILDGKWDLLKSFTEDRHYDRHLRWLVQLKYNPLASAAPSQDRERRETPKTKRISPASVESVQAESTLDTGMAEPSLAAEDSVGKKIGGYDILREIGEGGMGIVYEAKQISLDRTVAMKVLPQRLTHNSSFVQRFLNEAQAIAALNHPNIVQVYDVGHEGRTYYYTMELIEGKSLDDILFHRGTLSLGRAIALIAKVARALDYMHREGIVHRDVKPSNIMIAKRGGIKLTDFGLALQEGARRVTVEGGIVGTPEYMSPEQAAGETATAWSDIYSLGVVFYELMTGRVPFEADTPLGVIRKIQTEEPTPPRAIDAGIPPGIEKIILKMMAKDPDRRYENCRAVLKDMRRFRSGDRIQDLLPGILPPRRVLQAAAILLVIALLGGAIAHSVKTPEPQPKRPINEEEFRSRIAELEESFLFLERDLKELDSMLPEADFCDTVVLNSDEEIRGELIFITSDLINLRTEKGIESILTDRLKYLALARPEEKANTRRLRSEIQYMQRQVDELTSSIKKLRGLTGDTDEPLGLHRPHNPLTFGPLSPGKRDCRTITLLLNKKVKLRRIRHEFSKKLPRGITIETKILGEGKMLPVQISVSIDENLSFFERLSMKETYEGEIHFTAHRRDVTVEPPYVPIRIDLSAARPD